ncbi:MAG: hypothetical protein E6Q44_01895 [Flavobacteriales bacterium]|nr:MAG: hypothetical protein E6Q44_01895 [Flavobacteriales bacterium]
MARIGTFLLGVLISTTLWAQQGGGQVAARIGRLERQGVVFKPVEALRALPADRRTTGLWQKACTKAEVAMLAPEVVAELHTTRPAHMALTIPTTDGPLTVELERWAPLADGFVVNTATKGRVQVEEGLHYRGRVRGDDRSVVGLSVFRDEVMALVKDRQGTLVIGRLGEAAVGTHIIYREHDLRTRDPFHCGTADSGQAIHPSELQEQGGDRTVRCVKLYWEVDYPIFTNKGSVVAATNYATGLFNQSAILFDNDGIDVQLQEVFVWDATSPYTGPSSNDFLSQFGSYRTSFNGDLAHLLSFGGGGGVAWLNTLCSSTSYRMAYSGIGSSYSNVPTYSWSVNVVTHETGHNLGSPHTHDCSWNGNGTAIDGCGPAAGYTVSGCAAAPLPTGGGTIMSYCHLISGVGMNFNNGFGPQPATLIRNRVNAASCLAQCGTTCDAPGSLNVTNLTSNTATATWANLGVPSYTLQWKPQVSGTWTEVSGLTGNSYTITGLVENATYEFQVRSHCTVGTSAYSASRVFTTPIPCPDTLEANNTLATAAAIALPMDLSALIATASDVDYYSFSIPVTSTISIWLGGLPADYDVRLLTTSGTVLATSQNGGTSSEYITYANAAAGTYAVHVYGYGGAYSAVTCYNLAVMAFANTCGSPDGSNATDITYQSATLGWTVVQGASTYDVQWRETASPSWTLVTGVSTNSLALTGLNWSTAHQFQVRAVCGGAGGTGEGSTSEWSQPSSFTTLAPPCEVVPPTVVAAKVLLDGAWRNADQLMVDSLRHLGHLPQNEPYTAMGYAPTGATATTASVLATTGSNAIVDWVVVELRSSTTPSQVLEARAALLQRDGDIVAVDGTSAVGFCQAASTYHVAVRHRNHLGVMTAAPVSLGSTATAVDFSVATTTTWGTNAQKAANGRMLLWPGNTVNDAEVKYTGSSNDRDVILTLIGGGVPTNTVHGYHAEDVNLDSEVKYTGAANDRDVVLSTVGGSVPTNSVVQQLP